MIPQKPLVSIIVSAYNQERFIGRCLDLCRSNNPNKNYEIIVVNDGSTIKQPMLWNCFVIQKTLLL